jgi:hypothetical protein
LFHLDLYLRNMTPIFEENIKQFLIKSSIKLNKKRYHYNLMLSYEHCIFLYLFRTNYISSILFCSFWSGSFHIFISSILKCFLFFLVRDIIFYFNFEFLPVCRNTTDLFIDIILWTGHQWVMPVILVTWKAAIRRMEVWSHPGQIVHKTPASKKKKKQSEMNW